MTGNVTNRASPLLLAAGMVRLVGLLLALDIYERE